MSKFLTPIKALFFITTFFVIFAKNLLADEAQNAIIKPAIYFDDKIITNIDLKYYRQIIAVTLQDDGSEQKTNKNINNIIIDNLAKQKYYEKYINSNIVDEKTINTEVLNYLSVITKTLKGQAKKNFDNIVSNNYANNLLKLYIRNELLWTGVSSTVIAQSIQIDPSEIDAFLKIHQNYDQQSAYQHLVSQKLQPLSYGILEQIKNFTYTKIV